MMVSGSSHRAPDPSQQCSGTAAVIASARRAAQTGRYPALSLRTEWRSVAELATITAEWHALADHALEPNVFYQPAFALPAAAVFGRDAGAVLVWSPGTPRRLLGLFPARIARRRYGLRLPILVGWTHSYAPLGTPLVDPDAAEPVIAAWLDHVARNPALPGLVLLPLLPRHGPFAKALETILERGGMPAADFDMHRRALLAPNLGRAHYIERALGARKLKDLRRTGRRLAERGALQFGAALEAPTVLARLEEFFALEAAGWKGRAGTAAAQHDAVRNFLTAALGALAAEGKVRISRMMLDGRAIAAAIALRSGDTVWFWKIAYDEAYARFSPGVMLTVALTEQLLDDPTIARADSCATADHPMIDHIWRERLTLSDRLIAVRPDAPFLRARRLERLRRGIMAAAKRARVLLRAPAVRPARATAGG